MDGRMIVTDIDDGEKVVFFDQYGRRKKITGTKMGAILGCSRFSTPFKIALEIARIYPGDPPNKYMDAGNIIEPIIRKYVRDNASRIPEMFGIDGNVIIEEPVEKEVCGYDHFHDNNLFGGLVDGYVATGGKRIGILEIKTSSHRDAWTTEGSVKSEDAPADDAPKMSDSVPKTEVLHYWGSGMTIDRVPPDYLLQAGLYAALSGVDEIIFAVGFLKPEDYERPQFWEPSEENCAIVHVKAPDMSAAMKETEDWYHKYIDMGETPAWDETKDAELIKWLKSYDPNKKPKNGGGSGSGHKKYRQKRF